MCTSSSAGTAAPGVELFRGDTEDDGQPFNLIDGELPLPVLTAAFGA
jgi:hypothetical protein